MSCNGCRVLRKGCTDKCILRPCLQWIDSPESQAHATLFLAKFFGRAGLMSFISSVPETQRPSLFQSLLFEAAGRTVNPVNGAVGLLWTGNWHVCQASVDTVLRGGTLRPMTDGVDASDGFPMMPKVGDLGERVEDLVGSKMVGSEDLLPVVQGSGSPSMNSEESSVTVTCLEGGLRDYGYVQGGREFQVLNLFK